MRKQGLVLIGIVLLIAGVVTFLVIKNNNDGKDRPGVTSSSGVQQSDGSTGSGTDTTNGSTSNGSSEAAASDQVSIESFAFSPKTITVKKGTTLTWTNKDSTPHTVTGQDGKGPSSGTLNQGDTYKFTFNEAGSFAYFCKFHSSMTATVIVTE